MVTLHWGTTKQVPPLVGKRINDPASYFHGLLISMMKQFFENSQVLVLSLAYQHEGHANETSRDPRKK